MTIGGGNGNTMLDCLTIQSGSTAPAVPTNFAAGAGNDQVVLSWTASASAASYDLYRGTSSGGETLLASSIVGTSFTDTTNLTNGTTYYYQVSAVNVAGQSGVSSQTFATPLAAPPANWFSNNLPDPGLQNLAQADFSRDGSITYNDMLGLLNQAVTETATGNLSSAVVKSLEALASPSGANYLQMLPSVQGLTQNVVDGGAESAGGYMSYAVKTNPTKTQLQSSINQWLRGK